MLIVRADSEAAARERLLADPWSRRELLLIDAIHPREVLRGERPSEPGAHSADAIP